MSTKPDTYPESTFEDELHDLLKLAKESTEAACNANACGTQRDREEARMLDLKLNEHHEHFLDRWGRLTTHTAMEL